MHVCCWVLECVVEALGLDFAGLADLFCLLYVGDVFVVLGEHVVCLSAACGFFDPVGVVNVCCVCFGCFGVFVVFFG